MLIPLTYDQIFFPKQFDRSNISHVVSHPIFLNIFTPSILEKRKIKFEMSITILQIAQIIY